MADKKPINPHKKGTKAWQKFEDKVKKDAAAKKEANRKAASERTIKANKEARLKYLQTPKGKAETKKRRLAKSKAKAKTARTGKGPITKTDQAAAQAGKDLPSSKSQFRKFLRGVRGLAKGTGLAGITLAGADLAFNPNRKADREQIRKLRRQKEAEAKKGKRLQGRKTGFYVKPKAKSAPGYGWSKNVKPKPKPKTAVKPKAKAAVSHKFTPISTGKGKSKSAVKPRKYTPISTAKPKPATKKPAPKAKPKVKAKDFDYKLVRGYVPKSVPKKKK